MSNGHAHLSPSGSKKWLACPGSLVLEEAFTDNSNEHSDRGTACHLVAAWCLTKGVQASEYASTVVLVNPDPENFRGVEFTDEMVDLVQTYIDAIRRLSAGCDLFVEQRLDFTDWVKEEGDDLELQFGTADAVILKPVDSTFELQVHDAKFGFRFVDVRDNSQLKTYALGALSRFEITHDITHVRIFIHQPRLFSEPSEWSCTVEELIAFGAVLKAGAQRVVEAKRMYPVMMAKAWSKEFLNPKPNDDECAFCRAIPTCPAYTQMVANTLSGATRANIDDFPADLLDDDTRLTEANVEDFPIVLPEAHTLPANLAYMMSQVDAIEDWCLSVRGEIERRLVDASNHPDTIDALGYKLVLGRGGPRKWIDNAAVEEYLRKSVRLKVEDAYNLKVKSPTQVEEQLVKHDLVGAIQWKRLQASITRTPPKLSVARAGDKRPAAAIRPPQAGDFPVDNTEEIAS